MQGEIVDDGVRTEQLATEDITEDAAVMMEVEEQWLTGGS